jgi:FKBP-type peptidyl-prolyl cis-trans isomerase
VLQLMHEGDNWEVVIPAGLAYGRAGAGGVIPADQTLVFEIELLKVFPPPVEGCG